MRAAADLPWTPETTLAILDRAVLARPEATALICENQRLTYREYGQAVAVLAHRWADARGHRIVLILRNSLELAVAIFAAQAAGAAVATLNPDYTERELRLLLEDAAPRLIVTHPDLQELVDRAAAGQAPVSTLTPQDLAQALQEPAPPRPALSPDHVAVLQFTGGSTGRSKGVLLTHRAVAVNVAQREARLPTAFGDEVVVSAMPLFHVFAVAMGLHLAAYAAGTLVILPRYRPDWLIQAIEAHRGTRLPAGPTIYASLLNFEGLSAERLQSLRCCYSGSAPLSRDTLSRWEAAGGAPIYEGFGQSEAGPILTYQGPGLFRKPGTVGRALPHTEIEIVDAVCGLEPLPIGDLGEIRARGPQIMQGYFRNPSATTETLRDGWLYTGDIGRLDADGDLTIEDRKKDMVIVGGFNVYPREIDEVLMGHPAVAEASTVGAPDPYRGERLVAFVALRTDADTDPEALSLHCAALLTRYKRPAEIRLLQALPRTGVGKVDKPALRALARKVSAP